MNRVADNNFVSNARHMFENLLIGSEYSDVTLACEDDKQIKAHKFILGASSLFFKRIFLETQSQTHWFSYMISDILNYKQLWNLYTEVK